MPRDTCSRLMFLIPQVLTLAGVVWLSTARAEAQPIKVVASITILADMTREVGGDLVEVVSLVGPDSGVHGFEPTPADIRKIADAKLLVVNGLGLERRMDRLFKTAPTVPLAIATAGVAAIDRRADGEQRADAPKDPHAWQSLAAAEIYVANIAAGLVRVDPNNAARYADNAAAYRRRIADLSRTLKAEFDAIPPARRRVVSSHDAFAYFGRDFGVTFIPARGVDGDQEPSAKGVAALIGQIKREKIRAVFLESMSDPRLTERLAREAGAVIGGTLYSDALSPADGPAATYLAMFAYNARMLSAAIAAN
jgi:zinc/manganese transport system substrate-binding protein